MLARARSEGGFLTIELVVAIVLIMIALLALSAAYDQAFFSLHSSAKTSSAGLLAENQLELYASLPNSSVGLDASTLATVKSTDTTYTSDEAALPGSGSDLTISGCGSSPACSPVQTVTGTDGHSYKLETFIRALTNTSTCPNQDPSQCTASSWTERVVTVVVRDLSETGSPKVVTIQTGFDHGPAS